MLTSSELSTMLAPRLGKRRRARSSCKRGQFFLPVEASASKPRKVGMAHGSSDSMFFGDDVT